VLLGLLADPLPEVRARAAALLGELGAASAYTSLRAATKDADARVRAAAAAALPRLDLRPPYRLRIFALGRFQVLRGDEPIDERGWGGTMGRRLLARLLVAQGAPIFRPHLQDDLWPDADPAAAQHNLRVALNRLNDALEPQRSSGAPAYFILTPGDQVVFNIASDHEWDVRLWLDDLRAAEQAERDGPLDAALACYRQAFVRYTGPLLPDVDDAWVMPLRARLAEQFLALGRRLGKLLFDRGQVDAAAAVAARILEEEPGDEAAWALLMQVHLARGDRAAALRTYTRAVVALRAALDLSPGDELNALAAQARSSRT
jgi:LuxR family transcriptional regulator, maltose regulon positive regulatory protein